MTMLFAALTVFFLLTVLVAPALVPVVAWPVTVVSTLGVVTYEVWAHRHG